MSVAIFVPAAPTPDVLPAPAGERHTQPLTAIWSAVDFQGSFRWIQGVPCNR